MRVAGSRSSSGPVHGANLVRARPNDANLTKANLTDAELCGDEPGSESALATSRR
ncbi:pentapeptide repeat-containing protein [Streptomyces sp. NPDC015661]|uniref:pentapeptide repeat-containing protein n=1 Tax=Streptomyces sp. NPDC015661 TaxID=3364961 RepID=UPI0036FCCC2A